MTKRETIEEFLARGGKVEKIPASLPPEEHIVVKPITTGLPKVMTLDDGAHYFGETRKKVKKKPSRKESIKRIEKSNLPPDIIASLKKSLGVDNDK